MTYINRAQVALYDSGNIDAFGRLRTSDPETVFDSKQLYDGKLTEVC